MDSPQGLSSLDSLDITGKRVLVRCDFNVPIHQGIITDPTRIDRTAPTILNLLDRGARVILLSHLDNPKGQVKPEASLSQIRGTLSDALYGAPVKFCREAIGPIAEQAVADLKPSEVLLLENLRFWPGEEENDLSFARSLARLGDVYINDAFATSHRAHASLASLPLYFSHRGMGLLLESELNALTSALNTPKRPVMAIIGGAKVSSKLSLLRNLIHKVDKLVLGGSMANTLLVATGYSVGKSFFEPDLLEVAKDLINEATALKCDLLLPSDVMVASHLSPQTKVERVLVSHVPGNMIIYDIGPSTAATIMSHLAMCHTLIWNGPLGVYEVPPFNTGTETVAHEAAKLTHKGRLLSVGGGGDTIAALSQAGALGDFSYISTAGGAFLEWLEGKKLPGVESLRVKGDRSFS